MGLAVPSMTTSDEANVTGKAVDGGDDGVDLLVGQLGAIFLSQHLALGNEACRFPPLLPRCTYVEDAGHAGRTPLS